MIEKTANIGLIKEDEDEFYNIGTVNNNLDRIDEEFGKKVNKVEGKDLSSNDYTIAEKEKLKNIDENANNYTHPTTAGNKHIPSGGASGQVLKYGGASGTAEWGESTANSVTLWRGVVYDNLSNAIFYVPEKYWHNHNLTLMIDCVRYGLGEVNPPHSKTVIVTVTRLHEIYVVKDNVVKLNTYSAVLYSGTRNSSVSTVYEKFSDKYGECGDLIDISVMAEPLTTDNYTIVYVHKWDSSTYAITDIYAVIPQAQEQEG